MLTDETDGSEEAERLRRKTEQTVATKKFDQSPI